MGDDACEKCGGRVGHHEECPNGRPKAAVMRGVADADIRAGAVVTITIDAITGATRVRPAGSDT